MGYTNSMMQTPNPDNWQTACQRPGHRHLTVLDHLKLQSKVGVLSCCSIETSIAAKFPQWNLLNR